MDTCGFIALYSLFTAHFTGNFVLLGVAIAGDGSELAKVATLPVFLLAIAATCVLAEVLERSGRDALVPALLLEAAGLGAFLLAGLRAMPFVGEDDPRTLGVAAIGVAAMGVQNAIMRRVLPGAIPTTVMTTTLTQVMVDAVTVALAPPRRAAARAHLSRALPVVVGFAGGAVAAGIAWRQLAFAAVAIPLALMAPAVLLAWRRGAD